MAFWKFKAWLHHWVGKLITVGIVVGVIVVLLFFRNRFGWIWERISSAMTFNR